LLLLLFFFFLFFPLALSLPMFVATSLPLPLSRLEAAESDEDPVAEPDVEAISDVSPLATG
jgi:hypothetical protein